LITLPAHISNSNILTADQKTALANVPALPEPDPLFDDVHLNYIVQYYSLTPDEMDVEVHKHAAKLLSAGKVAEAWQVLLFTS
jgi:hypothetical protein